MKRLLIIGTLIYTMLSLPMQSNSQNAISVSPQLIEKENLRAFLTVLNVIKQRYVEIVDEKKLVEAALNGMLESLDPYSVYLNQEEYKDMVDRVNAEFGGLGIEFAFDGGIKVIAPIEDTPAYRAGINSGDIIIAINDINVADMTRIDAVKSMRGKPGSKVKLTIFRDGESKPLEFNITRELIKFNTVKYAYKDNIGYIRVLTFSKNTTETFINAYNDILKSNNNDIRGLIVDMRSNPGGLFNQAIDLSSLFVDTGNILSIKEREREESFATKSDGKAMIRNIPVVVLIDKGSASASEIFAGALQDHGKAIIMGSQSYGKGTVQITIDHDLPENYGGFKFTTAYFFTPKGHKIQGSGIKPNIAVEALDTSRIIENDDQKSKNLRGDKNSVSGKKINESLWNKIQELDNVLSRAFDLIKGIEVFETKQ
jgi:carboxyl-terminal processing protease